MKASEFVRKHYQANCIRKCMKLAKQMRDKVVKKYKAESSYNRKIEKKMEQQQIYEEKTSTLTDGPSNISQKGNQDANGNSGGAEKIHSL